MLNDENRDYYRFTGPYRLDKAMHTLEGIVRGISIDGVVNEVEVKSLAAWLHDVRPFANFHPFNEFAATVEHVMADGQIDDEERADLLWLFARLGRKNADYCLGSA